MEKRMLSIKPLILLVIANVLGIVLVMINKDIQSENIITLCAIMCGVNLIAYIAINLFALGDAYLFVIFPCFLPLVL